MMADPSRFDIQAVSPQLARDKQFQQIVYLCLNKIERLPAEVLEANSDELFVLLNTVVDIIDVLQTSLCLREGPSQGTQQPSAGVGASFSDSLNRAVKEMSIQEKIDMRNDLIEQLIRNDTTQRCLKTLIQQFLVKNKETDFLSERIQTQLPNLLAKESQTFVKTQSENGMLTLSQFKNIERLLNKAHEHYQLAIIVKDLLLEVITLKQEVQGNDQNLVDYKQICSERLDLVNKTLGPLESQFGDKLMNPMSSRVGGQITGSLGNQIEGVRELQ